MAFSKRQTAAENVRSVQFAGPSAALGPLLRPVQRPTLRPGGSATNRPLLLPPPASLPSPALNLRQLEVFHAIMRTGSVTAAAAELKVSQPAISAVLKHTEQRLRFNLFERQGGRLHPTPEATALLLDVNEIFGRVDTLARLVQNMRDGHAGRLVLASSPTLVNMLLPRAVAGGSALACGDLLADWQRCRRREQPAASGVARAGLAGCGPRLALAQ